MAYTQSEYQPSAGYNPSGSRASFGAAFLIHAAVIGALIMIPATVVIDRPDDGIGVIDIPMTPEEPDPEPEKIEPKLAEKPLIKPDPRLDAPPSPLKRPIDDRAHVTDVNTDGGLIDTGTDDGAIGGKGSGFPIEDITPKPDPVFVPPSINSRYAGSMQPIYPGSLKRQEIEGTVKVRVLVGTDGRVKKLERLDATHDAFFRTTERQSRKWRFNPATEDGKKVEAWYTVSLKFEMEP